MSLLILPTQLFNISIIGDVVNEHQIKQIFIIEEPRYFTDFKFHKLKLAYHRATMKKYYDMIKKKFKTNYINFDTVNDFYKNNKKTKIIIFDPIDHKLHKSIKKHFSNNTFIDNPNFLLSRNDIKENIHLFYNKKTNKYSHDKFYKFQRKKLDILMNNNKPEGGKWSYDNLNRDPLTKKIQIPSMPKKKNKKYSKEAIIYVNKNFKSNYGSLDNFIYPIDRKSSLKWLKIFLEERLSNYGKYQDAVDTKHPFVFHSILSPMMNIGLITDTDVIKISKKYYLKNKVNIPINSYEGFIRQVI